MLIRFMIFQVSLYLHVLPFMVKSSYRVFGSIVLTWDEQLYCTGNTLSGVSQGADVTTTIKIPHFTSIRKNL